MASPSTASHTAAPSVAGCLFQLERALVHLAAPANDAVAVEHIDDVTTFQGLAVAAQEQDKHTVTPTRRVLSDRSPALWRTLQIWVHQRRAGGRCATYLFACNSEIAGPIIDRIKALGANEGTTQDIVAALRQAGASHGRQGTRSKIQVIIDDVLQDDDASLSALVAGIRIVDGYEARDWQEPVVRGFALDPDLDHSAIFQSLFGWLAEALLEAWRRREPGIISRVSAVRQCRFLEQSLRRQRLLPRPASQVPVDPEQRAKAMTRRFVHHLTCIDATHDDVVQSVDHFLQFGAEKYRIGQEGSVAPSEWLHRGERLSTRWRNIMRQTKVHMAGADIRRIGNEVLMRTTYEHREPLAGTPCDELYMTSGHYHRLAENDDVWWDTTYVPKAGDEA